MSTFVKHYSKFWSSLASLPHDDTSLTEYFRSTLSFLCLQTTSVNPRERYSGNYVMYSKDSKEKLQDLGIWVPRIERPGGLPQVRSLTERIVDSEMQRLSVPLPVRSTSSPSRKPSVSNGDLSTDTSLPSSVSTYQNSNTSALAGMYGATSSATAYCSNHEGGGAWSRSQSSPQRRSVGLGHVEQAVQMPSQAQSASMFQKNHPSGESTRSSRRVHPDYSRRRRVQNHIMNARSDERNYVRPGAKRCGSHVEGLTGNDLSTREKKVHLLTISMFVGILRCSFLVTHAFNVRRFVNFLPEM